MGWQGAGYRLVSNALPLVAPALLRRRLARGKEDPSRWREKLGEATLPRPVGRLIWLHAVGLGEVLALRGLIGALAAQVPDLSFLITSSARSSAQALAGQLPPRTVHQFLPLDAPRYLARFLDHWRPGLSVWAEQDLWPGAVAAADAAGVPLALVNARMNAASFARRQRARGLYADLLSRFRLIAAQDEGTAGHLSALGGRAVQVTGSLKAAAPPLAADPAALAAAQDMVQGRRPWLLASSHPEDEATALAAQAQLYAADPSRLLILAPRDPGRGGQIATPLPVARRAGPVGGAAVWIVDTVGEMGLWYRLCPVTLTGGTFGPTEGHNPWEAAALGSAILHGPRVANFAADFAALDGAGAALPVTPETLAAAVTADHAARTGRATALSNAARGSLAPLARDLLELMA